MFTMVALIASLVVALLLYLIKVAFILLCISAAVFLMIMLTKMIIEFVRHLF